MAADSSILHPIARESFEIIDREIGVHSFSPEEYAIVRRVIHATADFEFQHLLRFENDAIARGKKALRDRVPIVADVSMVERGIVGLARKTFGNPVIIAVEAAAAIQPGETRSQNGLARCFDRYPEAIYAIGNAPTALLELCDRVCPNARPALVIGAPVGFVSVVESKQVLARTDVPQIRSEGRKGGSAVAAAIANALISLAWEANS